MATRTNDTALGCFNRSGRNDPRGRPAFDAWLEASRPERERDWREFMVCESDGYHLDTVTGLREARSYRHWLENSSAHPYRARGERLKIIPL
jgi:hypothetical protein